MEQEMLKQILTMLNRLDARLDRIETKQTEDFAKVDARMDRIEARMDGIESEMSSMKALQAKDSHLLNVIFENSIDLTERITGHDLIFDALQAVLQERKQAGAAF
jgi:Na+/phosphate symporter